MSEFKIPGGNEKGTAISAASASALSYWIKRIGDDLAKDPNKKFADRDRQWIAAAQAEQARRAAGGQPAAAAAPTTTSTSLATVDTTSISLGKSSRDPAAITAALNEFNSQFHLISPATTVDTLPEGFGVSLSLVKVDPSTDRNGPGEVYSVGGGKVGLSGPKILEIASAAGVDWSPAESGRLDNGRDPHYVHFRSVGYVRLFDGTQRRLVGEVEIDARDGSPQIEEITSKAENAEKRRDPRSQIMELRKFILRHAETKSKLRAVASMGIKRSYNTSELAKPFAVARLTWTGQSDDPELRRQFAVMGAEKMLGGVSALYGRPAPAAPVAPLPSAEQSFVGHDPPSVGEVSDDDYGDDSEPYDTTGEAAGAEQY